jgi:hypothetical protein
VRDPVTVPRPIDGLRSLFRDAPEGMRGPGMESPDGRTRPGFVIGSRRPRDYCGMMWKLRPARMPQNLKEESPAVASSSVT